MNARNFVQAESGVPVIVTPSLRKIITADWKLIILGALASFFLASILMSGAPAGLVPNLSEPFSYGGDGLFHAWMAQRVDEGWLFDNARSGYPFGSSFLDFPGADGGDHLIIKLTALLGGGWVAGVNLFFLLGFAACFIATYVTARAFGLNRSFSVAAGFIYTFAPFHFLRLQHLFYTWYFVAPLFFYLALTIYRTQRPSSSLRARTPLTKLLATAIGMVVLASFGVYYALFGIIILASAGILSAVRSGHLYGTLKAALLSAAVVAGVGLNIAPNLLGNLSQGPNPEVAKRSPIESEVYGLKVMQLLMPRADHRSSQLRDGAQRYNAAAPLSNENVTSSLGAIGSAGFMLALLVVALAPARLEVNDRLRLLAAITFVLFMFATIGGLGALFAIAVSPSIRGWNRASIFIACGAVLFFFIALQTLLEKKAPRLCNYSAVIASLLMLIGFYDQTVPACRECNANQKVAFENDRHFIQSIEEALPAGAAVYQLPYIGFPEVPIQHKLLNYQMMTGVLHSKALHWSFGGMKGRPGDLFYRALAAEPMAHQLEAIRQLGFAGIYVDRRGYADNGDAVINELSQLLNAQPTLQHPSHELVFFKLNDSEHPQLNGLSPQQIMQQAKFYADASGVRYPGNMADGIDFSRPGLPDFISSAIGLSSVEPWGRWSDQGKIKFEFFQPLPQAFTLVVQARAFASNAQKPTRVLIGDHEYDIQLTGGVTEIRLPVEGVNANSITFIPPSPISPQQLDSSSGDRRMIGIGFVSLRVEH
jgi:phosphoglycerol transferase